MCGIFALLNNDIHFGYQFVKEQFEKGMGRGPEYSSLTQAMIHTQFGFHRLAINGLNVQSNQPIIINDISLICNGEIYNYKELYKMMMLLQQLIPIVKLSYIYIKNMVWNKHYKC